VFLGPHLICIAASAGCVDIFGIKSNALSVPDAAALAVGITGLKVADEGKIVGRRGPRRDVKVLEECQ